MYVILNERMIQEVGELLPIALGLFLEVLVLLSYDWLRPTISIV